MSLSFRLKRSAIDAASGVQRFVRHLSGEQQQRERTRAIVETRLAALANAGGAAAGWKPQRTLIDGAWFNANYWYRVSLARAAMMTTCGEEFGILGTQNASRSRGTFARLGIKSIRSLGEIPDEMRSEAQKLAKRAIADTKSSADILNWQMPNTLPASIVYDYILKRQRTAQVDIAGPAFRTHGLTVFTDCLAAEWLINEIRPDLVLLSHGIGMPYAALGWSAMC